MKPNTVALWAGRVITVLVSLLFLFSGAMKFTSSPELTEGFNHLGWPITAAITLGILEIVCVLLYLIPPVSTLGAILLTGYLGGAIATHMRLGEPVFVQSLLGVLVWLGLFLRERRLRDVLPVRAKDFTYERQITIGVPAAEVFAYIRLLKNFKSWNPFLRKDPNTKQEHRGTDGETGFVAHWEGNRNVGSGEQEITKIVPGERVEFELRFFRPFQATNKAWFAVESLGSQQSRVRWGMSGQTKFPMTIFSLMCSFDKMIGREFEQGLSQLKTILEKRGAA